MIPREVIADQSKKVIFNCENQLPNLMKFFF